MEVKPFASLTSGLLARKGQAKPAMRPQGFGGFGMGAAPRDDLGWNDMGYDVQRPAAPEPAPIAMIVPVEAAPDAQPGDAPVVPPVVRQREELAQELAAHNAKSDEPEAVDAAPQAITASAAVAAPPTPARRKPAARKPAAKAVVESAVVHDAADAANGYRKAAFTLRLDAERHLRLRLATAVRNRSAQQLVTEALDQFLAAIPEVDDLAERVPARGAA